MFRNLLPEATKEKKNKDKKVNDAKIKRCIYCQHAQKNFLFCIKKNFLVAIKILTARSENKQYFYMEMQQKI